MRSIEIAHSYDGAAGGGPSTAILRPPVEQAGPATAHEVLNQLHGVPLPGKIEAIHAWFEDKVQASGIRDIAATGNTSLLAPHLQEHLTVLERKNALLMQDVRSPRADREIGRRMSLRRQADALTQGADPVAIIAQRVAQYPGGIHVVSDLDNTITDHSKLHKVNGIDPTLLGSALADPLHGPRRMYFPEAFVSIWGPLLRDFHSVFYEGGQHAPLREGAEDLFAYLNQQGIPTDILSTNFIPFVQAVAERVGASSETRLLAVTEDDITATLKGDILHSLAIAHPREGILYIGDGESDLPTLQAEYVVEGYGALAGSAFDKTLTDENIVHFTYETAHDIQNQLMQLQHLARN